MRHPLPVIVAGRARRRRVVAGLALLACLPVGSALATADAAGRVTVPTAGPTCKPWQTVTRIPVTPPAPSSPAPTTSATSATSTTSTTRPAPTASATTTPVPSRAVCRNAPPTPFSAPAWNPDSVVGGSRLGASGVIVDLGEATAPPPPVLDVAYVIADLDSGQILAAKSPHAWLRPASTLKTLTALTLIPRLDPRTLVTATTEHEDAAGTRVGMIAGNRYPVASLFEALLMVSANDAAYALADAAGGYERTVELMNDTAAAVGAHDTVVVDPSGLDEDGQRTSAYDLALIGRDAMRLPAFRGYIVKRDAVFPGGRDPRTGTVHAAFHIANINGLLTHYPGAIGIKPGRTNRAQHTFIGAATRGGRTLIVAQMGSTTGSWKPSAALLDWGFANADRVSAVGHLVEPGEAGPPVPAPTPTAPDATPSVPAVPVATGTPVPAIASGAWSGRTADLGFAAAVLLTGGLLTGLVRAGLRRRRGRA